MEKKKIKIKLQLQNAVFEPLLSTAAVIYLQSNIIAQSRFYLYRCVLIIMIITIVIIVIISSRRCKSLVALLIPYPCPPRHQTINYYTNAERSATVCVHYYYYYYFVYVLELRQKFIATADYTNESPWNVIKTVQ